jgi:Pentapeptide repeats (8 copies)
MFAYGQLQNNRRQLEHSIESSHQQHELDRQGQVTERFTRAIDQLGHESPDVQLGGIYALERIAKDSVQDRASIAEVLAAFVRNHAPWPSSRPGQPGDDWPIEDIPAMWAWAPEAQAALSVLGRQKLPIDLPRALDLRSTDLRRADQIEVQLQGVDFEGAQLWSADLRWARLREANFFEADLHEADLEGADLQGASLVLAELYDARLQDAQLQGADLRSAELQDANLRGAQMQKANLERSRLRGARYNNKTVWPDGFDYEAAGAKLKED